MSDKVAIKSFVQKSLAELGDGPSEIAENLKSWQITGVRHSETGCPIGNHLVNQFILHGLPKFKICVVLDRVLVFDPDKAEFESFILSVDLTHPAEAFLYQFDRGIYKELTST